MKKFILFCVIALSLSGCMDRTRGRMQDVFNDSARNAGESAGGG